MTVSTETASVSYNGNGSTTAFTVTFPFLQNSDITAILRDALGTETTWAETTDYTLTGAGGATGTLTAVAAPATGETVTILRDMPFTQETDYVANDPFPAEAHEQALDKATMLTQQLKLDSGLNVRFSKTVSDSPGLELTELSADRAGKYFRFKSDGDLELANIIGDVTGVVLLDEDDMISNSDTKGVTQQSLVSYVGIDDFYTDAGAADAYVLTMAGVKIDPTAYYDGMSVVFDTANPNTGATTVNVASLGVRAVVTPGGAALSSDAISGMTRLRFDAGNNRFELGGTAEGVTFDDSATLYTATNVQAAIEAAGFFDAYVKVSDVTALNVSAGTATSGAWQTRVINTEDSDDLGIASISSNQITLAAGTYICSISCPAYQVSDHQCKLRDITGGADLVLGTSERSVNTDNIPTRSMAVGQFTLAVQSALEVQHQVDTTKTTNGFGIGHGFGDNVYTIAEFWRKK